MITWMQRHRKYLVVTIWISTIAFIGAGFVGWGQYSYGEKAKAVAKVGEVDISLRELQQSYSILYNQYSKAFQGNFDEAQAKSFGLEKQAMKQLVDQALIMNLAESYGLRVSDSEMLKEITAQDAFYKDGVFDKETYRMVLKQNNINIKDYEADVKKSLLIEKTLALFTKKTHPLENRVLQAAVNIADKIDYKVLDAKEITLDTSDEAVKSFWETRQQNYMTLPAYELSVLSQPLISAGADEAALQEYHTANRHNFTDSEGKLLTFEEAKEQVEAALDEKATRKESLKKYIAFKKGTLDENASLKSVTIDAENNPYTAELFEEISGLTAANAYLKPRKVGDTFEVIKYVKTIPAAPKSFEAAMLDVRADYLNEQKQIKLQELAKNSVATFSGQTSPFVTREYTQNLEGLDAAESAQFINTIFDRQEKRGYITLNNEKIVLFHILEQKLLQTSQTDQGSIVTQLKSSMLDQGLIKLLENRYTVKTFIGGV